MRDDYQLLRAWQLGDADAGNVLVERYADPVYHFFFTKVEPSVAEDLAQATFETCVQVRERIDPTRSFRAYVLGIARKKLLQYHDEYRRRYGRFDELGEQPAAMGGTASRLVAAREEQSLIVTALRRLPLDFQIAIELHYWEGMTVLEIATVLDIPSGTVKSRLARSRRELRAHIETLQADPKVREATLSGMAKWLSSMRRLQSGGTSDVE